MHSLVYQFILLLQRRTIGPGFIAFVFFLENTKHSVRASSYVIKALLINWFLTQKLSHYEMKYKYC